MINIENKVIKKVEKFWNNIHFHPTDAIEDEWGQRILNEISKDGAANYVRMYAMLEDIVSKNENGQLLYDFTLNDLRIDYLLKKGFKILLSINFIPPCIAENSNTISKVCKNKTRYKGKMICTSRPADYGQWEEICYRYFEHIVKRYGIECVSQWYIQCYNEPDIPPFFLSELPDDEESTMIRLEEYLKLYRGFQSAAKRVSEKLKIGEAIAGKLDFLDGFLKKVKVESLKLDFVCVHNYGAMPAEIESGEKKLCVRNNIEKHKKFLEVINKYFKGIEVVCDEWGAATGGFLNCDDHPLLIYREDSRFAAYFGKMLHGYISDDCECAKHFICLSGQHEMTTDFSGFRNFFTLNFIKKPIYNAFVLGSSLFESVLHCRCDNENISVIPTKGDNGYSIMISYAAENFDEALPDLNETVSLFAEGRYRGSVWCIDENNTNPYNLSKRMGFAAELGEDEVLKLREEGNLKPLSEFECEGQTNIEFSCSNNALVLIKLERI